MKLKPTFVSVVMSVDRQRKSENGLKNWNGFMELNMVVTENQHEIIAS